MRYSSSLQDREARRGYLSRFERGVAIVVLAYTQLCRQHSNGWPAGMFPCTTVSGSCCGTYKAASEKAARYRCGARSRLWCEWCLHLAVAVGAIANAAE